MKTIHAYRKCRGYAGYECNISMIGYAPQRQRCDNCRPKHRNAEALRQYYERMGKDPNERKNRTCCGYEGYECDVLMSGYHILRKRCDKCAKKYESDRRKKRRQIKTKKRVTRNPKRKCRGYKGYKCSVSMIGYNPSRQRCDICKYKHRNIWQNERNKRMRRRHAASNKR